MIVSCEKEKLNSIVQTALRGVSSRVTMPILSGLLVNAESGKLVMSSTDLEMSIRAEMEADVSESGSTVVSGRLIGDIMKSLPGGEVSLETGDKYLAIKTSMGEYKIREMMPEDFPQIPGWQGESVLKASGGEFILAVQQTSRASSSDEKRPVLTGTLMEKVTGSGAVKLVSTDSYRLSWKDLEVRGAVESWEDCIIPTKTLNEVARIASSVEEEVEMKMQEKQVMFKLGDLVVSSRLIEGQFPNYKQLVPKGERTSVKVPKNDLSGMVKRALVFGHNMRLGIYQDHIKVTTETPEVGESQEQLPAEMSGEEMEIGFNGNYLLDGVTAVESDKVEIRLDDPQKPALIKEDEAESYSYILMPVRLR
jgi:DNA polymerase-3 subunit beta